MRGNWNTGGDSVADPAKGQQINVEHRGSDLPLHSPATPAWNIADRIVKEELPEDKNNDSGVSPGHYTSNSVSPRSRRSSSTANGSLSPGSATSQDSSAMQYEYSPQRIFKSCVSPLGFNSHTNGNRSPKLLQSPGSVYGHEISQGNNNRSIQISEQPLDMVSSTMKQDCDESDAIMQCPICPFNTVHRMQFNEHLAAHCSPKQCDTTGEYTVSAYTQLSSLSEDGARGSPSQGERSEHEFDDTDEPGLRVPRVNCQGKVKTFKCKQCNFTAVTKLAFWEHSRGHIKAEKLLTCPKCPFVTEYKHHLEYHLRNHFNSKPFKCDKCPYSCVNKSMLNSHLKSHSNVYQYRCAECSYATKYCHSLKLHLRKYAHKPAMVLNPDGSPNPLPIIDIYGTRRGPKQKSASKNNEDQIPNQILISSSATTPVSAGKITAIQPTPPSLFSSEHKNFLAIQHQHQHQHHQHQGAQINVPFSYGQIFNVVNNLPGGHFFQQFHDNNNLVNCNNDAGRKQLFDVFGFNRESKINNTEDFSNVVQKEPKRISPVTLFGNSNSNSNSNSNMKITDFESSNAIMSNCEETIIDNKELKGITSSEIDGSAVASPLDLSKPEITQNNNNTKTNSPRMGGTSRRKGRAFKLDKLIVAQDSEDESSPAEIETAGNLKNDIEKQFEFGFHHDNITIQQNNNKNEITSGGTSDYNCQYCDIAFGNVVMYTMHMGYHGYKNPYTCNMCGHECADKVSFFLHIARDSHS